MPLPLTPMQDAPQAVSIYSIPVDNRTVLVENHDDKPYVLSWDGVRYPIPPGLRAMVPWNAMVLALGDPEAVDVDARNRRRTQEYIRLRARYGAHEHDEVWEANKPRLVAVDPLSNEQIITVVDDPTGDNLNPAAMSVNQMESMQQQIAMLSTQLELMRRQQDVNFRAQQAEDGADPIVPDGGSLPEPSPFVQQAPPPPGRPGRPAAASQVTPPPPAFASSPVPSPAPSLAQGVHVRPPSPGPDVTDDEPSGLPSVQ